MVNSYLMLTYSRSYETLVSAEMPQMWFYNPYFGAVHGLFPGAYPEFF